MSKIHIRLIEANNAFAQTVNNIIDGHRGFHLGKSNGFNFEVDVDNDASLIELTEIIEQIQNEFEVDFVQFVG